MSFLKKISSAVNSRYIAFVDFMLSVSSLVFFYGGVQWEKQWMSVAVIAVIYTISGICLAANFAYLLLRALKGESYGELKCRKAIDIIHFVTGFAAFGICVYAICILFGVGGGISSEEIQRALEAVRPNILYLFIGLAVGIPLIFTVGARSTVKALCLAAVSGGIVIAVAAVLINPSVSMTTPNMKAEKIDLSSRKLLWSDEFDGNKLDETKWRVFDDNDHTTFYTKDQVSVRDGNAYLRTEYKKDGKYGDGFYGAWLSTENSFKNNYGYYEIRCIMPKAEGLHAAFWAFAASNPYSGYGKTGAEIDIFENAYYRVSGNDEKSNCKYTVNLHTGDDNGNLISTGIPAITTYTKTGKNMYEDFHTYGLEWTKDAYIFYYDGVEVGRIDFSKGAVNGIVGTCETPEFLYVSTHVGSQIREDGSVREEWNGNAFKNPEGTFPQDFIVDYVRVYAPAE